MKTLPHLFQSNRDWAARTAAADPAFFTRLSGQQSPQYLWIGCADSRVPATEICGLQPGEMFVHRNIANLVVHSDMNMLSVLQYAVEVLKVKHVIICGHYGCGGVKAAMGRDSYGLIDNWLRFIKDLYAKHHAAIEAIEDPNERVNRMCELNVAKQVANLCYTTIVQDAWKRGQPLSVHGWVYGLHDGLLKDLDMCVSAPEQLPEPYRID
ncbi:MAG: carbonate dehydratase [Deltaproteobacteria bacterium]|nr:carbonate dehydratase [Deltaproteobacteria bacterium]